MEQSTTFGYILKEIKVAKPTVVPPKTKVSEALKLMQQQRIGYVVITSEDWPIGIFTERDVLRLSAQGTNFLEEPIQKFMTKNPETMKETAPIAAAIYIMLQGGYRHVPITDDSGKVKAVFTADDLIEHLLSMTEDSSPGH